MYKRILVPTDGSDLSNDAIVAAAEFAKPLGASILLITVLEPYTYPSLSDYRPESIDDQDERNRSQAEERLAKAREIVETAGVPVKTISVKSFSPAEALIDASEEHGCDCIFMASHGRKGVAAVILGSETQKVLARSKIPVMVFR